MDDPLTDRDTHTFADGSLRARAARPGRDFHAHPVEHGRIAFPGHLNARMRFSAPDPRMATGNAWRNALLGVCVAMSVAGWCGATHVSADVLDAAAVMALLETSGARGLNASPLVSHDPHFIELTPVGLELIASRTRHAGKLAQIDEFDYRNPDGDAVILLAARAPLTSEEPHWSAQRVGDIRLLSWTVGGKRYVLAGHAGTRGLMHAADALTVAARVE